MTKPPAPEPAAPRPARVAEPATGSSDPLSEALARLAAGRPARRERDIVLFDIRGTGLSGALDCPFSLATERDSAGVFKRDVAACAAKVGPKAMFYSSREIVEDIERFREALGYARINLWGGSFEEIVDSISTRLYQLDDSTRVVPAAYLKRGIAEPRMNAGVRQCSERA